MSKKQDFTYQFTTIHSLFYSLSEQLQALLDSFPKENDNNINQQTISNIFVQLQQKNPNFDMERFWAIYENKRNRLSDITNKDSLTAYTPMQISSTLQAVLKQYNLLEISGTEGYRKLCRIAKMIEK